MAQEPERPTPEQFLAQIHSEQNTEMDAKLRIYMGYAAGVGKTYNMLREGNRLSSAGEDVVVGYVDTHGRRETQEQIGTLETIPVRRIPYRDVVLEEMDLDAILARRPKTALVDELAHTNAPGSKNEKRYQDVLELLAAGINVMTTVNIQHIESFNDVIFQITGTRVRETFPDWVVDRASEVLLVDVTPEQLLQRLREGRVYPDEERAQRALKNFFRKGNLMALRELALRKTAEEVDDSLGEYMREHGVSGPWRTVERILVAITPQPHARTLVRRGWRLAHRLKGELFTVVVETPARPLTDEGRVVLDSCFKLARGLGAEAVLLQGKDVVDVLLSFAREKQITQIVLGQGRASRWEEVTRGSLLDRLLRRAKDIDVIIVSEARKAF